jgi:hypothetical protein
MYTVTFVLFVGCTRVAHLERTRASTFRWSRRDTVSGDS